jgi:hypothetical protein
MTRRPSIPFTHGLHEDVCELVGERAALIFNRIAYYVEYNALAGEHSHDDQHFARVTVPDLLTVFHWLNKDKVTYAIKTLIEADLLCVPVNDAGEEINLSSLGWRRGKWYGHGLKSPINPKVEKFTLQSGKSSPSKVEKSAFEGGKSSPAIGDTSYYTSSYANTPTRTSASAPACLNKALVDQAKDAWNAMADKSGLDAVQLITPDRLRYIKARLDDVGGDWSAVLQAINGVPHDPHRTGHTPGGWQANFDWVFKSAANFTKCLEAKPRQKKDNADDPKHERSRSYDTAARLALANMGVGAGNEIHGFRPVGQTCRVDGAGGGRKLLSGPDNRRLCGDGLA